MKTKLLGLIACMALLGVSPVAATTYIVSDTATTVCCNYAGTAESLSLTGSITTDGHIGVLSLGNILSWDLTIGGFGTPPTLTPSSSDLVLVGSDLIATATALIFMYPDEETGYLEVIESGCTYVCTLAAFWDVAAEGPPYGVLELISSISPKPTEAVGLSFQSSDQIIAQTPLPAALPFFATGLGALGLFGWRRKRRARAGPRGFDAARGEFR